MQNTFFPYMFYIHSGFELTWLSSIEQVPSLHYKIIYRIYNIIIIKYNFQFCDLCGTCEGSASSHFLIHCGALCSFNTFGHSGFFSAQHITFDFLRFSCCECGLGFAFIFILLLAEIFEFIASIIISWNRFDWCKLREFSLFIYLKCFTIGPFIQSIFKKGDENRRSNKHAKEKEEQEQDDDDDDEE